MRARSAFLLLGHTQVQAIGDISRMGRGMGFLEYFIETEDIKLNKLKRKLKQLESKEHDFKVELEFAEDVRAKKPRKEVQNWLQEVGRTKSEVQDLEARIKKKGILKNLTLRSSIDRHTTEVNQLIQRGVFSDGLTLQVCDSGVPMVTTELVGENFQKNKNAIWEKLMNDNIPSVGVCGMGGIGKTTLITHIHDQLLGHRSSSVAWVTVSQNCGALKLQDKLAKVLGLGSLNEEDERKRAAVLASVLRKKKNFVLILDDIWDPIKLDEVGIPANETGCKLIITTRSLHVCQMMDCMGIIKVEPLSENDAWELFQMHLGQNTMLPSEIEEIGKSLVKEFADYPIHREGLIQHFIDEKLIREMKTRRAEFNRGRTILNKLETSCLLERGSRFGDKYVKMHDVVRDMAIKIGSMISPRFLVGVEAADKLEDEKLVKDTVRMSLIISDFDQDRTSYASPRCASLSMLRDCFLLKYMSSLENLKALRRLDLCRSGVRELPHGIDMLTNLRYLDLTCPIKIIPDEMDYYHKTTGNGVYLHEDDASESRGGVRIKQLLPCSCFSVPAFQILESLYLDDLQNLSDLVENLEYLEVGRCNQMVEIIEPFDELDCQQASSGISSTLPNLRHLHLSKLRELKIFCSTKLHFPSLKDNIYIKECPQVKRFPPLPPLSSSKEAAGSTSTISLKAIVIDAKERAKDTEPPSTKEVAGLLLPFLLKEWRRTSEAEIMPSSASTSAKQ
ncbi:hypothetical protein FNV43_RR21062 [Rhamnella rubrinervis]|uniref:AAA+ ATPase domain-containing protein n=1 Tax=Rhamnella rubrinervis TaxID=2594499 RepID=A0A8K0E2M0_9ROSA|nr:hypothetical protein FNV43_RR21062 [Rhamnella rubrinervis]